MIKYQASFITRPTITPLVITRETKKSVFIAGYRRDAHWPKITHDTKICHTWQEARDSLIQLVNERMAESQKWIEVCRGYITHWPNTKIHPIEVVKETKHNIWIEYAPGVGCRQSKNDPDRMILSTWEEARGFLLAMAKEQQAVRERALTEIMNIVFELETRSFDSEANSK